MGANAGVALGDWPLLFTNVDHQPNSRIKSYSAMSSRGSSPGWLRQIFHRHQRWQGELRHKLQSVLREDEPPSLSSVARSFNQERNLLRKYFPDVSREINERQAEFRRSQVENKSRV